MSSADVNTKSPAKMHHDTDAGVATDDIVDGQKQIKVPKSTPTKRKSKIERDREESEELIKAMGGAVNDGGRRTRSSARGGNTPAKSIIAPVTPPSAKKARISTPRRGRPRKEDNHEDDDLKELSEEPEDNSEPDDVKGLTGNDTKAIENDVKKAPEKMEVDSAKKEGSNQNDNEKKTQNNKNTDGEENNKEEAVENEKDEGEDAPIVQTDETAAELHNSDNKSDKNETNAVPIEKSDDKNSSTPKANKENSVQNESTGKKPTNQGDTLKSGAKVVENDSATKTITETSVTKSLAASTVATPTTPAPAAETLLTTASTDDSVKTTSNL